MNRRGFLQLLGAGLPAAVVCEKVGLLERVRTYFFAPQIGWAPPLLPNVTSTQIMALQLEKVREALPSLFNSDDIFYRMVNGGSVRVLMGQRQQRRPMTYQPIEWDKAVILNQP